MNAFPVATADPRSVAPRRDWTPSLLLLPLLAVFIVAYAIPMALMLATAFFRYDGRVGMIRILTFENFTKFLTDRFYLGTLVLTLKISVIVTLLSVLFGYPVAYYLHGSERREQAYLALAILSPLLVSLVVRSFGWVLLFSSNGAVNITLHALRLAETPIRLMYTQGAVIVGLVHVYVPFMILSVWSALQHIDPNSRQAAMGLGASPARAFWHVTLPQSMPGVIAGAVIVFALTVSSFVTPIILGGSSVKMMAYIVYEQAVNVLNWPFAAAVSLLLLALTGAAMAIAYYVLRRGQLAAMLQ
jgi:putative spermidine/putrescine transport system permease protein